MLSVETISIGSCTLDDFGVLSWTNGRMHLSRKQEQFIRYMNAHLNHPVHRDRIYLHLWTEEENTEASNVLGVLKSRLNSRFKELGAPLEIVNKWGFGYALMTKGNQNDRCNNDSGADHPAVRELCKETAVWLNWAVS